MKYQRRPHIEDRGVPEFQWPAEGEKRADSSVSAWHTQLHRKRDKKRLKKGPNVCDFVVCVGSATHRHVSSFEVVKYQRADKPSSTWPASAAMDQHCTGNRSVRFHRSAFHITGAEKQTRPATHTQTANKKPPPFRPTRRRPTKKKK